MRTLDRPGLEQVRAGIALQAYIPDSYPHTARIAGVGAPARGGGRRPHHHPPRQGREHGDRARRGLAARLAAGAVPYQDRDRRQLQAHGARADEAREPRGHGRRASPRTTSSISPTGWCSRTSAARWTRSSSRCSKAWRTSSAVRCSSCPATCCCTRRPAGEENFINAIGYLIRRLDENTGPENFLRHAFKHRGGQPGLAQAGAGLPGGVRGHSGAQRRPAPSPGPQPAASAGRCRVRVAGSTCTTSRTPISRCRRTANGLSRSWPGGSRAAAPTPCRFRS